MSTCFSSRMIPNVFGSAMSCRDIGGNGPPPRDTNQTPAHGLQSVQSVRRKLFGDVDHQQTERDLQRELRQCEDDDRRKYNFDFVREEPIHSIDSRYQWSQMPSEDNNKLQEFSTKIGKTSGDDKDGCARSDRSQHFAHSSPQSQSATRSPAPDPYTGVHIVVSSTSSATSAAIAPDSQPQPSSSTEELLSNVGQKHQLVNPSKQSKITEYFDGRKSAVSQRKRSLAQVVHKEIPTSKRHRSECSSAVKLDESDTGVSTPHVLDTSDEMSELTVPERDGSEDSAQSTSTSATPMSPTTGTPV